MVYENIANYITVHCQLYHESCLIVSLNPYLVIPSPITGRSGAGNSI